MQKSGHLPIKIGSRTSRLACVQVQEVINLLAQRAVSFDYVHVTSLSQGDRDKISSLKDHSVDNFFTDELDQAVLSGKVDIAVHSAKDLPKRLPDGLKIFALTKSLDPTDCLICDCTFKDLNKGARIGTSSGWRTQKLQEFRPDLIPVDIRGTIEERIKQFKDGKYDGVIVATVALKRLELEKNIKDILPWEGIALQGQLAVVGREDDQRLESLFSEIDERKHYGKVLLVGAGPGDPELITIKAINALKGADVVFYDYLLHKDILQYAHEAEKIYVGKRKGRHSLHQEELSRMLKEYALQGKRVVRLKGGDPFIFGRGAEEVEYIHDYHIPLEIIPGVSSATGLPTALGLPLTARNISSSVSFVTAHQRGENQEELPITIPKTDTVVVFMGLSKLKRVVEAFFQEGWSPEVPVLIISRGSYIDEKVIDGTLATITQKVEQRDLKPPSLIIVGQTVRFWKQRGQSRQNILYTGTNPQKYTRLGNIIHLPMVQISSCAIDPVQWQNILNDFASYDVILLTSQFGVRYFFAAVNEAGLQLDALSNKEFFVIGRHTANVLSEYGFSPSVIANLETSEGLLKEIEKTKDVSGLRILFPRSSLPNPFLKDELQKLGANVLEVTVYRNNKPAKQPLPDKKIDCIFFTSPSTVRHFIEDYQSIPNHWRILSKGDVTERFLQKHGYQSEILINS